MFYYLSFAMVYKCVAFGCKSGYKGHEQADDDIKITFNSFPLDNKDLCDRWIFHTFEIFQSVFVTLPAE